MRVADPLTRRSLYAGLIIGLLLATGSVWAAREERPTTTKPVCADDNGGITLPAGFCATVFADNIGHARHLVVAPNGVVYVNTWSGRYYGNDTPPAGGFLVGLLIPLVTAGPMSSFVSATASRPAVAGALASRSIVAGSSRRSTIASCGTHCPPPGSRRPRRRR